MMIQYNLELSFLMFKLYTVFSTSNNFMKHILKSLNSLLMFVFKSKSIYSIWIQFIIFWASNFIFHHNQDKNVQVNQNRMKKIKKEKSKIFQSSIIFTYLNRADSCRGKTSHVSSMTLMTTYIQQQRMYSFQGSGRYKSVGVFRHCFGHCWRQTLFGHQKNSQT